LGSLIILVSSKSLRQTREINFHSLVPALLFFEIFAGLKGDSFLGRGKLKTKRAQERVLLPLCYFRFIYFFGFQTNTREKDVGEPFLKRRTVLKRVPIFT
jgi:hypothetical protein